mmetsp:Transcript_99951/g.156273  ORF Transcript_99951/g.156273 Transcript_99951/m.156273 type:complete len:87 (-) Transcript_99951:327-587(-)
MSPTVADLKKVCKNTAPKVPEPQSTRASNQQGDGPSKDDDRMHVRNMIEETIAEYLRCCEVVQLRPVRWLTDYWQPLWCIVENNMY